MQDSVLVPLDGTAEAEAALPYARTVAHLAGREVRLIGPAGKLALSPIGKRFTKRDAGESGALRYLESVADGLEARVPLYGEITTGEPAPAVIQRIRQNDVAMVVLADQRERLPMRWLRSSPAEVIARNVDTPVMFVPPRASQQAGSPLHRLLVMYDGTTEARSELPAIADLCRFLRAEVVLLRLVEMPRARGPGHLRVMMSFYEIDTRVALRGLEDAARILRAEGYRAKIRAAVGDPTERIPFAAANEAVDAIVTLVPPRTPIWSFFIGDTMMHGMRRAKVPIIYLPPTWRWSATGPARPRPAFSAF